MPIPAGQLVKNQEVEKIHPDKPLSEAIELMIKFEFSQLPVVNEDGKPLGIVTGNSIARALLRFVDSTVRDLAVRDAVMIYPPQKSDTDLLDITDTILHASATLLTDDAGGLVGILTAYDTTQYFRTRAEDIGLLEDIENTLRAHIELVHTNKEVEKVISNISNPFIKSRNKCSEALKKLAKDSSMQLSEDSLISLLNQYFPNREEIKKLNELTLEELIQVAENSWSKIQPMFGTGLKKKSSWAKMMRNVSIIRNKIFHFRGELSEGERHSLRFCAMWYRTHQPILINDEAIHKKTPNLETLSTFGSVIPEPEFTHNIFYKEVDNDVNNIASIQTKRDVFKFEDSITNKYQPLANFLKTELPIGVNTFITTIHSIEKLINQQLPKAAREHSSWWVDYSTHTKQWLLTGWSVRSINLNTQEITFYRWSYHIDVNSGTQITKWASTFAIPESELINIIKMLGPLSTVIEDYLESNNI